MEYEIIYLLVAATIGIASIVFGVSVYKFSFLDSFLNARRSKRLAAKKQRAS